MRITVVQSGGVAGLRRESIVDTKDLPAVARDHVEGLIDRVRFFDLPHRAVRGDPDVIQYRVHVERSGKSHEIVFDDVTATPELNAIVGHVFERGSPRPRKG